MKSRTIVCSLLFVPVLAAAQDWLVYSTLKDGSRHSVDRTSLVKKSPIRRVWTMVEPAVPFAFDGRRVQAWMALVEVDCEQRTHRGLRELGYAEDGALVYEARSAAPLRDVVADSVGAARLEAICGLP